MNTNDVGSSVDDQEQPSPGKPLRKVLAALALTLVVFCVFRPSTARAAWAEIERLIELKSDPLPASPTKLSDHEIEGLSGLDPQKQAMLLLERAVNHYEGANELIAQHVDGWQGQLQLTSQMNDLLTTAFNSNDLRVRAAAIEVDLAANHLPKTSESALQLQQRIQDDPQSRSWSLWMLGLLGNRGVEPERTFTTLSDHLHDPDVQTRTWAVEGLAHLGSDAIIQPLLGVFHDDPSAQVRERAACSLAQSGMLTKEQRMMAVPGLLSMTDDQALDSATRGWVLQALRDITGVNIGSDPAAWRAWWAEHSGG